MPTYQYACTTSECGREFELVQSFTDPSATECPTCGGPVRKVFSAVGVVFKGSGFYRTDSRAASTAAEGGSKSSDSTADSGSRSKADAGSKSDSDSGSKSSSDSGSKPDSGATSSSSSSSTSASSAGSKASSGKAAAPA